MIQSSFPFNITTSFDENLREIPQDPEAMAAGLKWLLSRSESDSVPSAKARNLSLAGTLARILNNYELAAESFDVADKILSQLPDRRALVVNWIRWGHLLHWQGHFDLALEKFDCTQVEITNTPALQNLRDFLLQHKAKCLLDSGRITEAKACFSEALKLRLLKGDLELISSTQQGLNLCSVRER